MSKKENSKATNAKDVNDSGTQKSFDEKLDSVVESMGGAVGDLNNRVTGMEDSISQILSSVKAMNRPMGSSKFKDFDDGNEKSGVASFDDSGSLIQTSTGSVESPMFKRKMDSERFMNEPVEVYINESNDPKEDQVFMIGVNGEKEFFVRNHTKTVKRKFIEGLARCRPINYANREVKDHEGHPEYRYSSSRSTRYPFAIVSDPNPAGIEWLKKLRAETR